MRILTPYPYIMAFYDGRNDAPPYMEVANWVDTGALSVGIASYALVIGNAAIVYDTHVSVEHARLIRATLEEQGVERFTVVLSHWHLDHIAGNEVFADCEIIASRKTLAHMVANRAAIEGGSTREGPPAIRPLVMPTQTYEGRMTLSLGRAGG